MSQEGSYTLAHGVCSENSACFVQGLYHLPDIFPLNCCLLDTALRKFSRLARPVPMTSRGMPLIYFCVNLSIHFKLVVKQIRRPTFHFGPQRHCNHSSSSICRFFSTDKHGRGILVVFNFVVFVAALCKKVTSLVKLRKNQNVIEPQYKLLWTAWGARVAQLRGLIFFKGAYRPLRHTSYRPVGF